MPDITLIQALQNPALYNHPVSHFQVIETHISWILLTGGYAYKIKKPVDLGFLNFSSLAKRHRYCLQELTLNRRLAPQIYLDVIAIGGKPESPVLGAEPIFEYAVKMRQFSQSARLDNVLASHALKPEHIDQLADHIAAFHKQTEIADKECNYGKPTAVLKPVEENFQQIFSLLSDDGDIKRLETLKCWSLTQYAQLLPHIKQRKADGFVRNCHGDLHLANIALIDEQIVIFDCIEFNESLRWIDMISEIAFTTMDLIDRGNTSYAARLLDRYLQRTGDYAGLVLFQFYQVYRALVRAKVAIIRAHQPQLPQHEKQQAFKQYQEYITLAETLSHPYPQTFFITCGVSGSGKTTLTQPLLEKFGMIRLRSDVERKRLFGLSAEARTDPENQQKIYSVDASQRTFHHLLITTKKLCQSGFSVIIDATFLRQAHRQPFQALAKALNMPFVILQFNAEEKQLHQWIKKRTHANTDASDATIEVMQQQLATVEPPSENEADHLIRINSGDEHAADKLINAVSTMQGIVGAED